MRPPGIGELRDELALEQHVRVPSTGGGGVLTWDPLGSLWAHVRPLGGHETVFAGQIVSRVTHEIWIRHRAGTSATMRFRQDTRLFHILAVVPTGARGQWMRCLCREHAL